ncbi:MAG: 50S ribosomal protein L4 [Chloroflexi bacterium]|nr:MAG: 50S ribosomal protein L4 [Chloroflexota bacterium]
MLIPVKNVAGEQVGEIELSDAVFAAPVNNALMHQALVRQLANARLGTHDTKGRAEVSGGGRKPWRQKGTGRARQGSIRAPQWIGGGTVFGPTPRKYTQLLNKKMQRAALRSALSVKASARQIVVVDAITVDEPKTKQMVQILDNLGANGRSVLLVLAEKNEPVWRSAHNLPKVKTLISGYINVRDLLGHDTIVLAQDAAEHLDLWLGNDVKTVAGDMTASAPEVVGAAEQPVAAAPTENVGPESAPAPAVAADQPGEAAEEAGAAESGAAETAEAEE